MARIGKIARLPEAVREEICKRLRAGKLSPEILPWLNGLPEVQEVCKEFFDGSAVNAQNLSDWRNGGYRDWEEKQDRRYQRLEHIRELAGMSLKLAQAGGGSLTEGAAAILGGNILDVLEQVETLQGLISDDSDGADVSDKTARLKAIAEALDSVTGSVARLRRGDQDNVILRQNDRKLDQKDQDLALERVRLDAMLNKAAERLLDEALRQQAASIASSNLSNAEKIAALRKVAFADVDALEASGAVQLPG